MQGREIPQVGLATGGSSGAAALNLAAAMMSSAQKAARMLQRGLVAQTRQWKGSRLPQARARPSSKGHA